jgi:sec-independent protein translocase protein TatA
MGGWGSPIHWLVIGVVALLLFGNRLPDVARSLGKAFREFKRGLSEMSDELGREDDDRKDDDKDAKRLDSPTDRSKSREFNAPREREEYSNDRVRERDEEHEQR